MLDSSVRLFRQLLLRSPPQALIDDITPEIAVGWATLAATAPGARLDRRLMVDVVPGGGNGTQEQQLSKRARLQVRCIGRRRSRSPMKPGSSLHPQFADLLCRASAGENSTANTPDFPRRLSGAGREGAGGIWRRSHLHAACRRPGRESRTCRCGRCAWCPGGHLADSAEKQQPGLRRPDKAAPDRECNSAASCRHDHVFLDGEPGNS